MDKTFITASETFCTLTDRVPEFYFRKAFLSPEGAEKVSLSISGLGFYRLYLNGKELTKGLLAPYISNPDHYCYFDVYDLTPHLLPGENALGVLLGNGFLNSWDGYVWDGDKASFRASPRLALECKAERNGKTQILFTADESFKVHASPLRYDGERYGECYDARLEIPGWNAPGFDDSDWQNAKRTEAPKGQLRECKAEPIRTYEVKKPIAIFKSPNGYIYDFGVNSAGLCRLTLKAPERGQTVTLRHGERVKDGALVLAGACFTPQRFPDHMFGNQKDTYIAKGDAEESWMPGFTYHGFRYVEVSGIRKDQATEDLLSYHLMSSDLRPAGSFTCSDETLNTLFAMAQNSDRSNLYYFPTDCPHREKNGWTGDAAISVFHMMLLYHCETSFAEWMANIRAAQRDGKLPGIVPTAGFGYDWGNGPAWDRAAFYLPYEVYRLRGNTDILHENSDLFLSYLEYVKSRRSEDGTIAIGLGDWGSVGRRYSRFATPLAVTDSILTMDMAQKAETMFRAIGQTERAAFAKDFANEMRTAIRRELLDPEEAILKGRTQTGQAMGLYYGVFEEGEREKAFSILLSLIHEANDSLDCGILGTEVIFHVLSSFGQSDLAYKMIAKPEYPSYRHLIDRGETGLPERFMPDNEPEDSHFDSHNHHFFGDIARWFMQEVAGLRVGSANAVTISPNPPKGITYAEAFYELPTGKVALDWKEENGKTRLTYQCPPDVNLALDLPQGWEVIQRKEPR